jgi:hypothetical protein
LAAWVTKASSIPNSLIRRLAADNSPRSLVEVPGFRAWCNVSGTWQNRAMAVDKSGELWRGEGFADLAEYLRHFQAGGYSVDKVVESMCRSCNGRAFRVMVDDEVGCAQRVCVACGTPAFIADSAEYWGDAEPGECACPCGGEEFAVAVAFALHDDGDVRWISIGLRCLADNTLGVYADWKINYSPSDHLLSQA